jgi:23S rRNA pseudouridine1911/1915/1917 synthase
MDAPAAPAPPMELVVPASRPGARLDAWLRDQLPHVSRGALQRLLAGGHIRVNGEQAKPDRAPRAGDRVTVTWPAPQPAEARPEAIPLAVLHEDDDLLVLDKAPGLVVHPSAGHDAGTLVNALLHHCAGRLSGIGGVLRPGIVHRLDRDTSGCLVVAKHDAAHQALARQFAGRVLEKTYLALVCGVPAAAGGEIRAAIARHPNHRQRMAVTDGGGRAAWTTWRRRERLRGAALIEADLHTGRTHQLRVHCLHLGHPVVGDATYGRRQNARLAEDSGVAAPRQMLHAWRLALTHPATGDRMAFEAPVPADFEAVLRALRG